MLSSAAAAATLLVPGIALLDLVDVWNIWIFMLFALLSSHSFVPFAAFRRHNSVFPTVIWRQSDSIVVRTSTLTLDFPHAHEQHWDLEHWFEYILPIGSKFPLSRIPKVRAVCVCVYVCVWATCEDQFYKASLLHCMFKVNGQNIIDGVGTDKNSRSAVLLWIAYI